MNLKAIVDYMQLKRLEYIKLSSAYCSTYIKFYAFSPQQECNKITHSFHALGLIILGYLSKHPKNPIRSSNILREKFRSIFNANGIFANFRHEELGSGSVSRVCGDTRV